MKLLVCTSNQPRHVTLVKRLQQAGHDVLTIVEPKTYQAPPGFSSYWEAVREAEFEIFGLAFVMPGPVICLRPGELSSFATGPMTHRFPVVFSSSYIRSPLVDFFIDQGAINLHVGISPEYRGSAPNMWAHYNGRPDLIGAQVQRLAKKMDGGSILKEVRPPLDAGDYFKRSMLACKLGIDAVVNLLDEPEPWAELDTTGRVELSYTRHEAFTDKVAQQILDTA